MVGFGIHVWGVLLRVALASAVVVVPSAAAEAKCGDPPERYLAHVEAIVRELDDALQKNVRQRLRSWLVDPLLVRLDGKRQRVQWKVVNARFDEIFGPRVREAVHAGQIKRVGNRTWTVGDHALYITEMLHGKACRLEIDRVFEQPAPEGASKAPLRTLLRRETAVRATSGDTDECTVTLGSRPWAHVWIDGKDAGKVTPLAGYRVACGKHTVTFKRPDLKLEQTEMIVVPRPSLMPDFRVCGFSSDGDCP